MGFFSWLTCDTNESISNRYSARGPLTAYVLIPKEFGGGFIKETNYEGYGVFGGRDIFALIANWNNPDGCTGNDEDDRDIGIDLYYDKNNPIKYGIKIASEPMAYEDAEISEDCPDQGYFYCDEEDEEGAWYDEDDWHNEDDEEDDWDDDDEYDDWYDEDEDDEE